MADNPIEEVEWLRRWLERTRNRAEDRLAELCGDRDAWRVLRPHLLGEPFPAFSYHPERATDALGEEFVEQDGAAAGGASGASLSGRPGADLVGDDLDPLDDDEWLDPLPAPNSKKIPRAREVHPIVDKAESWSEAELAATVSQTIELLGRIEGMGDRIPEIGRIIREVFSAGFAIRDYQARRRSPELRALAAVWARRQLSRVAGKKKRGRIMDHVELVRRALVYDSESCSERDDWTTGGIRRSSLVDVLKTLANEDECSSSSAGPSMRKWTRCCQRRGAVRRS